MVHSLPACIFYGIGSRYVYESIEIARRSGVEIRAFVDNRQGNEHPPAVSLPLPAISITEAAEKKLFNYLVHIPLITPGYRKKLVEELCFYEQVHYLDLIDSSAIVAQSCTYGEGFSANALVVVGANSHFGKHVLINRSVSIGHDAEIADYVTFGPGSILCGSCRIDTGVFIGAGAIISPEIHIGKNATIGAGAVVVKNIAEGAVVVGNPARVVKEKQPGYNGVGV